MPFEVGNKLAVGRAKPINEAIIRELKQNPAKLKAAIAAQLDAAANGDLDALDWLTCRVEGKAQQSINVDDNDRPLFQAIKMVIVTNSNGINGLAVGDGGGEGLIIDGESRQDEGRTLPQSVISGEGCGVNEVSPNLNISSPNDLTIVPAVDLTDNVGVK